jgi:tetratricopeptide (TPR) repeat protein
MCSVVDLEKLIATNPGSVVFPRYADRLHREGRTREAMEVLNNGIRANPFLASGFSVLADILFQQGSNDKALENLMTAVKIDPQRPGDLLRLGEYFRTRDPEKAKTFFRAARAYDPSPTAPKAVTPPKVVNPSARVVETPPPVLPEEPPEPSPPEEPAVTPEAVAAPFDEPVVQEVEEEEGDFYAVLGSFGEEKTGEDLDELFSTLSGESISETERPENISMREGTVAIEEPEHAGSASGDVPEPAFAPEFGIVDEEKEEPDTEKILDIGEEEEYDLTRYGFEPPVEEEIPVLTDEERAELLALVSSEESEEEEPPAPVSSAQGDTASPVEESEEDNPSGADSESTIMESLNGNLSSEEIEFLSAVEEETSGEGTLDNEISEGIDYSDVLAEWNGPAEAADSPHGDIELFEEELGALDEVMAGLFVEEAAPEGIVSETNVEKEEFILSIPELGEVRGIGEKPAEEPAAESESPEIAAEEPEPEPEPVEPAHVSEPSDGDDLDSLAAELTAQGETGIVSGGETLDMLIAEYTMALEHAPEPPDDAETPLPENVVLSIAAEAAEADLPRTESRSREGYTATIAEIYVSQGLVSRAREIYETLVELNPGNESFRNRLAELKTLLDQQSDS